MRFLLFALLFILTPYSQAQIIKEYIAGGRFFGEISQANHLEWGKYFNIKSNISCDILKSFKPIKISNYNTQNKNDLKRYKNLYYGLSVTFSGYWTNTEEFHQTKYTIGPSFLVKYYTPIDLFLQTSIGFEFEKIINSQNDPSAIMLFVPTVHSFGFVSEIFTGYSFKLPDKALIEPSISYKIVRSNIYLPDNTEVLSSPENSFNFYLGIFFIINRQLE